MNLVRTLDLLEKLEMELGLAYRHLSTMFSSDPEVSRLFIELAEDEDSHRLAVRYQQRLVRNNSEGFSEIALDLPALNQMFQDIERVKNTRNMGVVDALKFAKQTELGAGEHHLKNAMSATNRGIANLLQSLGSGDKEHLNKVGKLLNLRAGAV